MSKLLELEELLEGNATIQQVADFLEQGNFPTDTDFEAVVEKYLQTEQQRQDIFKRQLNLSKIFNGRYERKNEKFVNKLLAYWNKKLCREIFT